MIPEYSPPAKSPDLLEAERIAHDGLSLGGDSNADKVARAYLFLLWRVRERALREIVEEVLVCTDCGHLRSEHHEGDAPCYGGRTPDMPPEEGEFCGCDGFQFPAEEP